MNDQIESKCISLLALSKSTLASPSRHSLSECISLTRSLLKSTANLDISMQERYIDRVRIVESILRDALKDVKTIGLLGKATRRLFKQNESSPQNNQDVQAKLLEAMLGVFKVVEMNGLLNKPLEMSLSKQSDQPGKSEAGEHSMPDIYTSLKCKLDNILQSQEFILSSHETLGHSTRSLNSDINLRKDSRVDVSVRRIIDPLIYTPKTENTSILDASLRHIGDLIGRSSEKWTWGSIHISLPTMIFEDRKQKTCMTIPLRFAEIDTPMLVADKNTIRVNVLDGSKFLVRFVCESDCELWKGLIALGIKCSSN